MSINMLVTGSTGFLGSRLTIALSSRPDIILTSVVRRRVEISTAHNLEVHDLASNTDWSSTLSNQQVVIHTAARTHIMEAEAVDTLIEYRLHK